MPNIFNSSVKYSLNVLFILLIFLLSTACLWLAVTNRPLLKIIPNAVDTNNELEKKLKFPTCLEDVKALFEILLEYKEENLLYIYILFFLAYIYKQTFAIPGSVLLNILAGALFGCWPIGIILCSTLTAFGATNCYLLSKFAGKDIIYNYFPSQVTWLREKVLENESGLLVFLIGLRLFPATPNWMINIISPIVNVPIHLFFISVFTGLLPYNFLCLKAGETLSEIESLDDVFTPRHLLVLLGSAVSVFTLSYFSNKRKVKLK